MFGRLTQDRPNLLTATRVAPDGTLRPSLLSFRPEGTDEVAQAAPAPVINTLDSGVISLSAIGTTVPTVAPTQQPEPVVQEEVNTLAAALDAAPTQAVHTVRLGESLNTLALRYYRDASKADMIFEANRRILGDARKLTIGQLIRIPDLSNL